MFCSSCGVKNDANAKFCNGCGKPFGESAQSNSSSSESGSSSQASGTPVVNKCPACRAPIESFQTRCSSCGTELGSAQSGESVASFFKKLDDLTQKEYEADKQRERETGKKKQKQSMPLKICELIAIFSFVLLVLHITGINKTILSYLDGNFAFFENSTAPNTVVISNNSPYDQDTYISVNVMVKNSSGQLQDFASGSVPKGGSSSIQLNEGDEYLILVRDGVNDEFYYPHQTSSGTTVRMDGTIRLNFSGTSLIRR